MPLSGSLLHRNNQTSEHLLSPLPRAFGTLPSCSLFATTYLASFSSNHLLFSPYSPPHALLHHPSAKMSFVKLSIFGTSFEVLSHLLEPFITWAHTVLQVTTRYVDLQPVGMGTSFSHLRVRFILLVLQAIFPRCFWSRLVPLPSISYRRPLYLLSPRVSSSSAKDQLTGASVAVKKIMKPFSTPVLAKRTYRELKLLKHIQHENVRIFTIVAYMLHRDVFKLIYLVYYRS